METHGNHCKCAQFKLSQKGGAVTADDNLFAAIAQNQSQALNVTHSDSLKLILRPESRKHEFDARTHVLESHSNDPEVIIVLRFRAEIKLRAINLIARQWGLPDELNL